MVPLMSWLGQVGFLSRGVERVGDTQSHYLPPEQGWTEVTTCLFCTPSLDLP